MYGLALQGGGAKGAYEIGALKAIIEYDFDIGAVVGTSIGSFNGAVFAQGDFDKLYDLWINGSSTMIMDIDEKEIKKAMEKKIDLNTIKYWTEFLKQKIKNKGIETEKIKKLYDDYVDEKKLRDSGLDFGIVTYNLTDKKPLIIYKEDMEEGKLASYLLASSYLPVFKQEKIINERNYIDGGIYDNCPLSLLTDKGYKDIIEVKTGSFFKPRKIDRSGLNIITIEPSKDTGSILFSDNKMIRTNINMGYFDAIRVFEKYIGKKYYIIPATDKKIFKMFADLTDEKIMKIIGDAKINKSKNIVEPKKILFEIILPNISASLKNEDTTSYQNMLVSCMEEVLTDTDTEIYKIYKFEALLEKAKLKVPKIIRKQKKTIIKNDNKAMMLRLLQEI